jgi:hypothetical protein
MFSYNELSNNIACVRYGLGPGTVRLTVWFSVFSKTLIPVVIRAGESQSYVQAHTSHTDWKAGLNFAGQPLAFWLCSTLYRSSFNGRDT